MTTETVLQSRRDMLTLMGRTAGGVALGQALPTFAGAAQAPMAGELTITVDEAPSQQSVAAYGWLLGKPFPTGPDAIAFRTPTVSSRREHIFDSGKGGEDEVVWVEYANADPLVNRLEKHPLTQQAVVPLIGTVIQIVATSNSAGMPDMASIRAFRLIPGIGLCMAPGVWHSTRSKGSTCLMLTRGSTSVDILDHRKGKPMTETTLQPVTPFRVVEDTSKAG